MSIRKRLWKWLFFFFSVSFIFDMPRITKNLPEFAFGTLNAGMTMNVVAVNIGCSTRAIRHLRQRFQAKWHMEDRPCSGGLHITTHGQDCYILNTHLHNRFQTAIAIAVNTHGKHNNRISAQTAQLLVRRWAKCTSSICWLCFGMMSLCKWC